MDALPGSKSKSASDWLPLVLWTNQVKWGKKRGMTKLDAHYTDPKLAEIYDFGNGWSADRDFYLDVAGIQPIRILDLGCGTGLICDAYVAKNHQVTGVDPAASMLDVARRKPNGKKIDWVLSSSQTYFSENRFDLIIMTGHAFQVLLTESDIRSAFNVMRRHLAPGGRVVFESRNPDIDWQSRWNRISKLNLPAGEVVIERQTGKCEGNRLHFLTYYHFANETLVSQSELRFWTHEEIIRVLNECHLKVVEFFGDWDKNPFDPISSEEMIFIVQAMSRHS